MRIQPTAHAVINPVVCDVTEDAVRQRYKIGAWSRLRATGNFREDESRRQVFRCGGYRTLEAVAPYAKRHWSLACR